MFSQADGDTGRHDVGAERPHRSMIGALNVVSETLISQPATRAPALAVELLSQVAPLHSVGLWLLAHDDSLASLAWSSQIDVDGQAGSSIKERLETLAREALDAPLNQFVSYDEADRRIATDGWWYACVPLSMAGHRFGVLCLTAKRRLSEDELAVLAVLCRQIAGAIFPGWTARTAGRDDSSADRASLTRFVAVICHELRTPLTALRGNIQLASMAARKADLERTEVRLQAALQSTDDIASLVRNLQDFSHIERGKFQLAPVTADLVTTIENAVRRAERTAASDRHEIHTEFSQSAISVHDPVRLEQAIYNMVLNAIQYSPAGGRVLVQVGYDQGSALITISDHGIGIQPAERESIFEPYYRGETGRQANAKGLGLGLTISKETVERHGGSVEVASNPGGGSTFVVQLPLQQPTPA